MPLFVHVTAMRDSGYVNRPGRIIDLVDNAIIAHSNAPIAYRRL
jgi:hypothetical protein